MAISTITGKNYSFKNGIINFFGTKGLRTKNNYAINIFGGDLMVEVTLDDPTSDLRDCIEEDVRAGNGDKIALLIVTPTFAVNLFLMGIITVQHLKRTNETHVLDIPDVQILDKSLTVRIDPDTDYNFATADEDGNIL